MECEMKKRRMQRERGLEEESQKIRVVKCSGE